LNTVSVEGKVNKLKLENKSLAHVYDGVELFKITDEKTLNN